MLFKCNRDCYDNQRCAGYKMGVVYELTPDAIDVMKKNGLFPKVFEPADFEAAQFVKPAEPKAKEISPAKDVPKKGA